MNILLVVATTFESQQLQQAFPFEKEEDWYVCDFKGGKLFLLHTGIGMTSTAFMLGRFLTLRKVDLAINFGIAGSFDTKIKLGEVLEIREDSFAELGAEDEEKWLNLRDLGFAQFTQENNSYYNTFSNPSPALFDIPKCKGITVNRTHGHIPSIEKSQQYWPVQVETMEGAAFFHAMIRSGISFYAFRSISNYVEKRNKAAWELPMAIKNIQTWIQEKLHEGAFHKG
jgi:futalosine hydrolase